MENDRVKPGVRWQDVETGARAQEIDSRVQMMRQAGRIIFLVLDYALLLFIAIAMLIPMYWMIITSLKTPDKVFTLPIEWWPNPIAWGNYKEAMQSAPFGLFALNSVKITVLSVVAQLLFSALAGFGFARLKFPGSDMMFALLLGSMMIPYTVTLIPSYIMYQKMGWIDTHWPLIVPPALGGAFGTFLMRQFFASLPWELQDAAKIDGCGNIEIFWRIMLPLVKPAIAALTIFSFLARWNSFLGPLIYLNSMKKWTLPIGLATFRGEYFGKWNLLMAASTLMIMPVLVIYVIAQKYFIQGIVMTGLKG